MSVRKLARFFAVLLAVAIVAAGLPSVGPAAAAGPDLQLEYLGWDPTIPDLINFRVTNVGDAPSAPTAGKGETLRPPPAQETAPPIPALAPNASFDFPYPLYPGLSCANHVVRISVPLADDQDPDNNTLLVEVCRTDEGADLKLEYLGIDPANAQRVKFRVSNVGIEPTDATTGRVEALAPAAPETPLTIPALAPGAGQELTYQLAGASGCDGHELRASVPLAGDRYPPDNSRYVMVCAPKPPPEDDPIVVGPAPREIPRPEHLQPGPRTLEFRSGERRNPRVQRPDPACEEYAEAHRPWTVGFQNADEVPGGCVWRQYWRLAFRFDFSALRGHTFTPVDAVLTYNEQLYYERDPDGTHPDYGPRLFGTCGLRLGVPTVEWHRQDGRDRYAFLKPTDGIGRVGGILDHVVRMIDDPAAEARGLALVGPNEAMSLDRAACMSEISPLTLTFRYEIPDR